MPFRSPYPGYDVLSKWDSPSFDHRTRDVIGQRLTHVPERRFFTPEECQLVDALAARLVPQGERADPVPITPWIDEALANGRGEGFRRPDMPGMRETWRCGLAAIAAEALVRHGTGFADLTPPQQDSLLASLQGGKPQTDAWGNLPPGRFFSDVLLKTVVGIYYAHPAAWNEIGFGGPASPRGYVRMDPDRRDPWEARELPDG